MIAVKRSNRYSEQMGGISFSNRTHDISVAKSFLEILRKKQNNFQGASSQYVVRSRD